MKTVEEGIQICSNVLGVTSWETHAPKHWGTYKFLVLQFNEAIVTCGLFHVAPDALSKGDCIAGDSGWNKSSLQRDNVKFVGPLDEDEFNIFHTILKPFHGNFYVKLNS